MSQEMMIIRFAIKSTELANVIRKYSSEIMNDNEDEEGDINLDDFIDADYADYEGNVYADCNNITIGSLVTSEYDEMGDIWRPDKETPKGKNITGWLLDVICCGDRRNKLSKEGKDYIRNNLELLDESIEKYKIIHLEYLPWGQSSVYYEMYDGDSPIAYEMTPDKWERMWDKKNKAEAQGIFEKYNKNMDDYSLDGVFAGDVFWDLYDLPVFIQLMRKFGDKKKYVKSGCNDNSINDLLNALDKNSIDPKDVDFQNKIVLTDFSHIDGEGIYSYDAERYNSMGTKEQKSDYSMQRQKGIHAVQSGNERVFVDWMWSIEVPAGFSYSADYECNALDIDGRPYALQIQKTEDSDFSEGYPAEINLAVRQANMSFNMYTSDARMVKNAIMEYASAIGDAQIIKEDKDILVIMSEAYMFSDSYSFTVCVGGRNVAYNGQIIFNSDAWDQDTKSIALDFLKTIEPVLISDLKDKSELVRLGKDYLPELDTGNYLTVDDNFRVPVPEGYDAMDNPFGSIKGPRAAVMPKGAEWTERGYRCKVGFIVSSDPGDVGDYSPKEIVNAYKQMMEAQTGSDLFNNPITTVRDNNKGTIVYSTVVNTASDENTNAVLIITGGKAYYCILTITYDEVIADDYDVIWDAKVITTAWLSRILFKGESEPKKKTGESEAAIGAKPLELADVNPDESLYPHYGSMMNAGNLGLPGMQVIVNQSGTEYEFHTFKSMLNSYSTDPEDEKIKPLLRKIYDQNPEGYTLGETARKMARLFRVNKDAFVEGHDRESELLGNLMRRAYMMSALRSFAWTLANYCEQENATPETIDKSIPEQIADFAAMNEWLNYDDKSYCKGLCSGSDLHVYFIPDSVSEDDRKQFLPTQDDYDRVKNMQEQFPSYFEILPEVHSLDSLRKDLEYIYPAVRILYEDLAAHRDHSEPLEGNAADVVYAWIALAMAAEGPFFTEDGPTNYRFGWPGEGEEIVTPEQNDDAWGSGITVGGKAINDNDTGTSVDNDQDDAWGSGITVGGKAINDNDARTSVDDNQDDVWGSGITVGGKKI